MVSAKLFFNGCLDAVLLEATMGVRIRRGWGDRVALRSHDGSAELDTCGDEASLLPSIGREARPGWVRSGPS